MRIGAFHDVQVVQSTPYVVIGSQPGVAMLACIYTGPLIDILLSVSCTPAKPVSVVYYFILHVRAVASSIISFPSCYGTLLT